MAEKAFSQREPGNLNDPLSIDKATIVPSLRLPPLHRCSTVHFKVSLRAGKGTGEHLRGGALNASVDETRAKSWQQLKVVSRCPPLIRGTKTRLDLNVPLFTHQQPPETLPGDSEVSAGWTEVSAGWTEARPAAPGVRRRQMVKSSVDSCEPRSWTGFH